MRVSPYPASRPDKPRDSVKGFHVTPAHFYQPIPNTQSLPETLWNRPSELVGIEMNDGVELDLLRNHFPKFRSEYNQFPAEPTNEPRRFRFNNGLFDGTDALVAYCMIRHFQSRLIIGGGSGFSSLVTGQAIAKNKSSALIYVEPFPQEFLKQSIPVRIHSYRKKWKTSFLASFRNSALVAYCLTTVLIP